MQVCVRWRDMLESGEYGTIREIANTEKINESYVGRVLRLTLLPPDIEVKRSMTSSSSSVIPGNRKENVHRSWRTVGLHC